MNFNIGDIVQVINVTQETNKAFIGKVGKVNSSNQSNTMITLDGDYMPKKFNTKHLKLIKKVKRVRIDYEF